MGRKRKRGVAEGQIGDSKQLDPKYVGWMDHVAHPDSPAGGGGPGGFSQSRITESEGISLPVGKTNDASQIVPMNTDVPKPPNSPPVTKPSSLRKLLEKNTDYWDVSIAVQVVADGTSTGGIKTSHGKPDFQAPEHETDGTDKLTAFVGKFVWRGTIDIKTVYGPGFNANTVTCYGRGTTANDVKNRDITLGFHEHQHQQDFIKYLDTHAFPALPTMKIDMSAKKYLKEKARFKKELDKYWKDMEADTKAKTDEVGHKKSTRISDGTCYVHLLPEEEADA